jgi:hypothetical protein
VRLFWKRQKEGFLRCANSIFFAVTKYFFFPNTWKDSRGMQSEGREACTAHGCGGAAGKQAAQEQTALDALQEKIFEDMRLLATQHAVPPYRFLPWFALV